MRGTLDAVRRVEKARGTRFAPLAILPTFVDGRRSGAHAAEMLLREAFDDLVLDGVRARCPHGSTPPRWPACPSCCRRRRTTAAVAYRSAARELLARLGGKRVAPGRRKAVKGFVRADMRESLQGLRRGG